MAGLVKHTSLVPSVAAGARAKKKRDDRASSRYLSFSSNFGWPHRLVNAGQARTR
jgi:hypothetical protein